MSKVNILAISGSIRKISTNNSILRHISNVFSDQLKVVIYDQIDQLPHFNPDLDIEPLPPAVSEFRKLIDEADGVIICTPEYVFSLPGSLKNAIEWNVSTTLFSNKPVALIVASASGEKAFESLDLIMKTIESRITGELLIQGAKGKINQEGKVDDPEIKAQLNTLIYSLISEINSQNSG